MPRKIIILLLMLAYLYLLEFDIFLNGWFPLPTPILFVFPLIIFFRAPELVTHSNKGIVIYFFACLLYFVWGQEDIKNFAVSLINFLCCYFYFQFFIGYSRRRFTVSMVIFFSFLALSAIVMYMNHLNPDVDSLRARLLGDPIKQSPSGITANIFTFGYQAAALTVFTFLYTVAKKKYILSIPVAVLGLLVIYYGMQRSALVDFFCCAALFFILYLGFKKFMLLSVCVVIAIFALIPSSVFSDDSRNQNIFSKNNKNREFNEERSDLVRENLRIYSNYPFGLIFYGKKWGDVIRGNPNYPDGITSHNAYLMFMTYLGPILGIPFLIALYFRVGRVFIYTIKQVRLRGDPMLIGLSFAFLAVSINSCFHNGWLLEMANGVIIFLYMSVTHYYDAFVLPRKAATAGVPATITNHSFTLRNQPA